MYWGICMPQCMCGRQGTTCRSQFPLCVLWSWGIKLGLSGLATGPANTVSYLVDPYSALLCTA